MVLHSGGCGRVGHRRTTIVPEPRTRLGSGFRCLTTKTGPGHPLPATRGPLPAAARPATTPKPLPTLGIGYPQHVWISFLTAAPQRGLQPCSGGVAAIRLSSGRRLLGRGWHASVSRSNRFSVAKVCTPTFSSAESRDGCAELRKAVHPRSNEVQKISNPSFISVRWVVKI